MATEEFDEHSGTETTGHQWDGIKELNTPLPRWWLWTFYATVVWSLGYCIAYPAWPLIESVTPGVLGYSSRADVAEELANAATAQEAYVERMRTADLETIRGDADLLTFALAGGESAYSVNCSQCHGSGAAGAAGYPNLNDDEWLWGGTLEDIYLTVAHGVRFEADDDTRYSEMPAFGRDEILPRDEVADITEHVLALGRQDHDADAAARGEEPYLDNCAACHADDGSGDRELGAPALNDAIWLYSRDGATIRAQIDDPKHGVMPAWAHRLDDVVIKQLTLFVHALGGGE
jgi:cytochrome c oxidase cbb3-type subunit 3